MKRKKTQQTFLTREEVLSQLPENATAREKWAEVEEILDPFRSHRFDGSRTPKMPCCVWVPETKVLVVPPDVLVWLGVDEPKVAVVANLGRYALAKYVITGGKNITWDDIAWDDADKYGQTGEHRMTQMSVQSLKKLEEPYRTRLTAFLLSTKK